MHVDQMNTYSFTLNKIILQALSSGALWVESEGLLCVSDLHLGKSDRIARRLGLMLPPYESTETLSRLGEIIEQTKPRLVLCLGDSFDDLEAEASLSQAERDTLNTLQAGRDWIWIAGNHDPLPLSVGGQCMRDFSINGLVFRHEATDALFEVSGHYHPKHRIKNGRSRPAFIHDERRVIMPAFGLYTGGLSATSSEIRHWFPNRAIAVLCGGATPMPVPL